MKSEELIKLFDEFIRLIEDQFTYGGKKYALNKERESTDVLFDNHGKNWLFGTIDKYIFRFNNLGRERDLLKIATYKYITWLKRGFHIDYKRIIPIDTNIETKIKYFSEFINRIKTGWCYKYYIDQEQLDWGKYEPPEELEKRGLYYGDLNKVSSILQEFSKIKWEQITEGKIIEILLRTFFVWCYKVKDKGKDKDTWLEKEKENEKK